MPDRMHEPDTVVIKLVTDAPPCTWFDFHRLSDRYVNAHDYGVHPAGTLRVLSFSHGESEAEPGRYVRLIECERRRAGWEPELPRFDFAVFERERPPG